jgi:hypothetical protein
MNLKLTSPPIFDAAVIAERVPADNTLPASCSATTKEDANLTELKHERPTVVRSADPNLNGAKTHQNKIAKDGPSIILYHFLPLSQVEM